MENTKNNRILAVILFIVVFAIAFFGTKYLFSGNSDEAELKKIAAEVNKSCPMTINSETRLDNTEVIGKAKIQYNYTLLKIAEGDTIINFPILKKTLQEQSQQNFDTNPQMEHFRVKDISMKYYYKDMNGKYLFDFTIDPKE